MPPGSVCFGERRIRSEWPLVTLNGLSMDPVRAAASRLYPRKLRTQEIERAPTILNLTVEFS